MNFDGLTDQEESVLGAAEWLRQVVMDQLPQPERDHLALVLGYTQDAVMRNAVHEGQIFVSVDALCDALAAARIGEYDGATVEQHLEALIPHLRNGESK